MPDERRRFTRVPFNVKAEMMVNKVLYSAERINNLSIGGCLLPIEGDFDPGAACHVKVLMSGTTSELSVQIDGEIVRSVPKAVAVKFTRINPDSLFHLRNIVRYNSSDLESVEKEIQFRPGLV